MEVGSAGTHTSGPHRYVDKSCLEGLGGLLSSWKLTLSVPGLGGASHSAVGWIQWQPLVLDSGCQLQTWVWGGCGTPWWALEVREEPAGTDQGHSGCLGPSPGWSLALGKAEKRSEKWRGHLSMASVWDFAGEQAKELRPSLYSCTLSHMPLCGPRCLLTGRHTFSN